MDVRIPTAEQRTAVERTGRFVLRACPGSGKTYTVALRLADRVRSWNQRQAGVAAISFTNVACDEIGQALLEAGIEHGLRSPHFLGTLDAFIDTFIFLPFGHRVMQCGKRPVLVGFEGRPWSQTGSWAWRHSDCYSKRCDLTHFSWDLDDGRLVDIRSRPADCQLNHAQCLTLKNRFTRAGYATQTDAAYWAVRILQEHPWLAKALVRRFPQVIVDEAQDTSRAQMKILDILVEAGLQEIVLVGDADQAIYEWRAAHPELIEEKARETEFWRAPIELTQNLRSTQAICDATFPFSTLARSAKGRAGGIQPELWEYDPGNPGALIDRFLRYCEDHGVPPSPETTALLVRGRALLRRVLGVVDDLSPWHDNAPATRPLARAAVERDRRRNRASLKEVELAAVQLLGHDPADVNLRDLLPDEPEWQVRVKLNRLQRALPPSDWSLGRWLAAAVEQVRGWAPDTGWDFRGDPTARLKVKAYTAYGNDRRFKGFLDWPLTAFFDGPAHPLRTTVDTIHSAKGKTYEAVLLALPARGDCTPKELAEASPRHECLRTVYVAMTRPRELLVVAVPERTPEGRLGRFVGFVTK